MNTQVLHNPKLVDLSDLVLEPVIWIHNAMTMVKVWVERDRQRRNLLSLDDRMLNDIGLTREQASAEANKPFWE